MTVNIVKIGDVMYDAALYYKRFAKKPDVDVAEDFVLCTVHRAENTESEQRLRDIFGALEEVGKEIQIILPIHPRTRKKLKEYNITVRNITFLEPVGYLEMIRLLDNCKLVVTDSGGLQKEAYFFRKACITLRNETEWIELVEIGVNALVGTDRERIISALESFSSQLLDTHNYLLNLYGDGRAGEKIVRGLLE